MGSAIYSMEVRFPSPGALKAALPGIRAFIREGAKAEAWWHNNRTCEKSGHRGEFWERFKNLFPNIYTYLQGSGHADGDCNTGLAGILDFGTPDEIEDYFDLYYPDDEEPDESASVFAYEMEVWRLATWDYFGNHLKHQFGAVSFLWVSDEE